MTEEKAKCGLTRVPIAIQSGDRSAPSLREKERLRYRRRRQQQVTDGFGSNSSGQSRSLAGVLHRPLSVPLQHVAVYIVHEWVWLCQVSVEPRLVLDSEIQLYPMSGMTYIVILIIRPSNYLPHLVFSSQKFAVDSEVIFAAMACSVVLLICRKALHGS